MGPLESRSWQGGYTLSESFPKAVLDARVDVVGGCVRWLVGLEQTERRSLEGFASTDE